MSFLDETLQMAKEALKDPGFTVEDMCAGAGIKPRWYYKVKAGEHRRGPDLLAVQKLHTYLNRRLKRKKKAA